MKCCKREAISNSILLKADLGLS